MDSGVGLVGGGLHLYGVLFSWGGWGWVGGRGFCSLFFYRGWGVGVGARGDVTDNAAERPTDRQLP